MSQHADWRRGPQTSPAALALVEVHIPDLWRRVWEADRWCQRAHEPRQLWSAELDPAVLDAEGALPASASEGAEAGVEALVARRRACLGEAPGPPSALRPQAGGICWYLPAMNLCCGTAEFESEGLFNVHNVPGWDTWLLFRALPWELAVQIGVDRSWSPRPEPVLLAWIPGHLLAFAAEGIGHNPERCIGWLHDPRRG